MTSPMTPRKPKSTSPNVTLENGTSWPDPRDPFEIQYKLRYGGPLSPSEMMVAASFVSAYCDLMLHPSRELRIRTATRMRRALAKATP